MSSSPLKPVPIAGFFIAAGFLVLTAGVIIAEFKVFPYPQLYGAAFDYLRASQTRAQTIRADLAIEKAGVEAALALPPQPGSYGGLTFTTCVLDRPSTAVLLDEQGKVIHTWHKPFRQAYPDTPHVESPSEEDAVSWRYGRMFPNGDILVVVQGHGDTPSGYGLIKLDKDSNLLWAYPARAHHQVSVGPDGHVWALVNEWRDVSARPLPGNPPTAPRILEDFVVELSPEGRELRRVSITDALMDSPYAAWMHSALRTGHDALDWDPIHSNDVEPVTPEFAAQNPGLSTDQVIISLRDLDALVVIDMNSGRLTHAIRGAWLRQHDPDLLPSGRVLLFDNRGHFGPGGISRIMEIDLLTGGVYWTYTGTPENPFNCVLAGAQDRLPNGNTLIGGDYAGRLFEVTPEGRVVWEYRGGRTRPGQRFLPGELTFTPADFTEATVSGADGNQTPR